MKRSELLRVEGYEVNGAVMDFKQGILAPSIIMGAYYMSEDHWLASPLRVTNLLEMATTRRKPKVR